MGKTTSIGWCDGTFNPWWGCVRVSPGCEHCYAEAFSKRVGQNVWGPAKTTPRRMFGDAHWRQPELWNSAAVEQGLRMRVFCASMADVFEEHPDLPQPRARLFDLIERTPHLDWQLLTKRPENVMRMVPYSWRAAFPPNVWLGASAEDQQRVDNRAPHLVSIPAKVLFLSCEPLLGDLDLRPWLAGVDVVRRERSRGPVVLRPRPGVNWVIVGGESGHGARFMDQAWARSIIDQCRAVGVPVFTKQLGAGHAPGKSDAKAEDVTYWPHELRVQDFPRQLQEARAHG